MASSPLHMIQQVAFNQLAIFQLLHEKKAKISA
jgi:hypothetical protein